MSNIDDILRIADIFVTSKITSEQIQDIFVTQWMTSNDRAIETKEIKRTLSLRAKSVLESTSPTTYRESKLRLV